MRRWIIVACMAAATALAAGAFADVADLAPVVKPYLRIQQALASDSIDGIGDAALAVAEEAARLGDAAAPIAAAAGELGQAGEIASARAAFGRLGDAIMRYANESQAPLGHLVRVAYCPMLRKYWLQDGETIRNPFYGKTMLDCGRISPKIPDLRK